MSIAVVGINHVSLQLMAALSQCGLKNIQLIDHGLLRNLDFYRDDREVPFGPRPLTVPKDVVRYDEWEKNDASESD